MPVVWPRKTILPKSATDRVTESDTAPPVSVVIPTYNRATLLPRAIASVLAQTFLDFELIVVDDGSTDGSARVARSYTDPRIRVVLLPANHGVARALNEGIVEARGQFVALLGDDDEWLPELLQRLTIRLQEDAAAALVYASVDLEPPLTSKERKGLVRQLPDGNVLDHLLAGTIQLVGSACLVRRSVLLQLGGFDETIRRGEDTDLWLRISLASHRVAVIREPLAIVHRDHGLNQLTHDHVLEAVAFERFHRRWGRLSRKRLGADTYEKRRRWRLQRLRREHRKVVKGLGRIGDRAAAWRYAQQMFPTLPWGAPHIAQALSVVALGPWPYRLRRAKKSLRRAKSGDVTQAD